MAREKGYDCDDMFVKRWSPRALTKTGISKKVLLKIFEAARWAPSSCNEQLWRFLYVLSGEKGWNEILASLVEFNQSWAKTAGALIVICASSEFSKNQKPNRHASFDSGAAWMNMALQAQKFGLYTHGMAGFDPQKVRDSFDIPTNIEVLAVIAIGGLGAKKSLPKEMQKDEMLSSRHEVKKFAFEGEFKSE